MPRPCTVCTHAARAAIETALVDGVSFRNIAKQQRVSIGALSRHKAEHLPRVLAAGQAAQEPVRALAKQRGVPEHAAALAARVAGQEQAAAQRGIDLMAELERCFARVNKLFDACDAWLTDPDDPTRYDIGPRAGDITVVYLEATGDGFAHRKKKLSALLQQLVDHGLPVVSTEYRHADPRKLVLETAAQLRSQLELLVDLMERAHNARRMEQFQEALLAAIGEADETTKQRLVARLRSLRGAGFDPRPH